MNDYLEQIDKLVDSLVTRDTHRGSVNRVRLQAKEALLNILTDAQREARINTLKQYSTIVEDAPLDKTDI